MTPLKSDELEHYGDTLRDLDKELTKLKKTEVRDTAILDLTASLARQWIQFSTHLRELNIVSSDVLAPYDEAMAETLNSTKKRSRASTLRKHLTAFQNHYNDEIVIPAIKYEGSPDQAAARQISGTLSSNLNPEEASYIEEAVRCASTRCYRATIILLWSAAVARFHTAIEKAGFDAYNSALQACASKKGPPFNKLQKAEISSLAELQRMRDFDLLVAGMDLWGYDLQAFQELERLLSVRNTAAHPGMYMPTALDIQQFVSKLDVLVFRVIGK